MPKLTLQQRLVDALVTTGRGTPVSRSRKYVTLKRPDEKFFLHGWHQVRPRCRPRRRHVAEYEGCLVFSSRSRRHMLRL